MKVSNPVKVLVSAGGGLGVILALHQAQVIGATNTSADTNAPSVSATAKARTSQLESAISALTKQEQAVKNQLSQTSSELATKQQELAQASAAAIAAEQRAASTAISSSYTAVAKSPTPAATTRASSASGGDDSGGDD
ncbi:MAG: hypothetical protein M0Z34_05970 [Nitrospiraceae bacterium]|nr:hypothetical protein [Nitrospiraceae bacterium]MDA8262036.1 hypothetical protein [Actinomycetota bacterium]